MGPLGLDSGSADGGAACDAGPCDLGCDEATVDARNDALPSVVPALT